MKKLSFAIVQLLLLSILNGQSNGFFDDFEDGRLDTLWEGSSHLLWKADHSRTFGLMESGGVLSIAYTRTTESDAWDNFNFTPPADIDVSENPNISLSIKSDLATTITLKPIYSNENHDWLQKELPGDGLWHDYSFALVPENYNGALLRKIYLYLDGGSTAIKSGQVLFDDFRIAGFSLSVVDLKAEIIDSVSIQLSWESSSAEQTDFYRIYRSLEESFTADESSRIAEIADTSYLDTPLVENTVFHYQVSAVDREGREHSTTRISARTYTPGKAPAPAVLTVNTSNPGRYEKFEIVADLRDASYTNPYDPAEIELHAWFHAPSGDSVQINGFYDNFQGRDQWKIRFAPDETGTWTYYLVAEDADGIGYSESSTFNAVESSSSGWLRISPENSNYLVHDDGSSFYGLAVYYPWAVTQNGLDKLTEKQVNIFGYWDCTFDGEGNGGGRYLLESMESGLGRYDQRKAARIDEVLYWAETRGLKVMLAIWTHGYLRIDNVPWDNGLWYEKNPYSSLVEPEEFFTDSLALAYQDKHHRYLIARYGYSQALGIWELINEAHGTTGWVRNQAGTKKWVERTHAYFKENDPMGRPTTASFGGSQGASHFSTDDKLGDIPNVHFYEEHGWPTKYPEDLVRSGLHNLVSESNKLKSKGDRPAFLGEAGYTSMLTDHQSEDYSWELHNAFWAGLCNGLASTPFWWEFNTSEVLSEERLDEYSSLKNFVRDIPFNRTAYTPIVFTAAGADAYFMTSDSSGFGWLKSYNNKLPAGLPIAIPYSDLFNGSYHLDWFSTEDGNLLERDSCYTIEGLSWGRVSDLNKREDAALKLSYIGEGAAATRIHLELVEVDTTMESAYAWLPPLDSSLHKLVCYVTDASGILDQGFNEEIQLSFESKAGSEQRTLALIKGGRIVGNMGPVDGGLRIRAEADGLESAELIIGDSINVHTEEMHIVAGPEVGELYPNPASAGSSLPLLLHSDAMVLLEICSSDGRKIDILESQYFPAGNHMIRFDLNNYYPGIYLLRLSAGNEHFQRRLILNK